MKSRICPICVLVSGTWITLLIARSLGSQIDLALIAMLIGGSVVGLAYTLAKRLPPDRHTSWKLFSIPLGFVTAYSALMGLWFICAGALVGLGAVVLFFFGRKKNKSASSEAAELEDKMKQCC